MTEYIVFDYKLRNSFNLICTSTVLMGANIMKNFYS